MKKIDNKGISLVELLIAIAVMVLLLSPIMLQLFQSVNLSGQAKEKQYVVDSSNEVIETFRKIDSNSIEVGVLNADALMGDLSGTGVSVTDVRPVVELEANGLYKLKASSNYKADNQVDTETGRGKRKCYIYDASGNALSYKKKNDDGTYTIYNYVEYTYSRYELNDVNLGKKNTEYNRYVVLTDLVNKLYEAGYEIDYDISSNASVPSGFERRSDNTIVKMYTPSESDVTNGDDLPYDVYDDSRIVGVVCKSKTLDQAVIDKLQDPNQMEFGDIQDIDVNKMAIISGDATTLDYQVETDIQSAMVQLIAKNKAEGVVNSLSQYYDDPQGLNNYVKTVVRNPAAMSKARNIHVIVTAGHKADGTIDLDANGKPKFYEVRCDVIYEIKFASTEVEDPETKEMVSVDSDITIFDNYTKAKGTFKYTVLNRRFYTTTPPDVYMIYEPLLLTTNTGTSVAAADVYYNIDDYISVSSDKYTSGEDASKIYLIRSTENWQKATGTTLESTYADDGTNTYYTNWYGKTESVRIHIIQGFFKEANTKYYTDNQKWLKVYTNINLDPVENERFKKLTIGSYKTDYQFGVMHVGSNPGFILDDIEEKEYYDPEKEYDEETLTQAEINYLRLNQFVRSVYSENEATSERLFKTTVVYKNSTSGEETYLTGAKGAN